MTVGSSRRSGFRGRGGRRDSLDSSLFGQRKWTELDGVSEQMRQLWIASTTVHGLSCRECDQLERTTLMLAEASSARCIWHLTRGCGLWRPWPFVPQPALHHGQGNLSATCPVVLLPEAGQARVERVNAYLPQQILAGL